jgi:hypothetical protein
LAKRDADWALADRVSDRIVNIMREEIERPGFNPTQAFAGQMLAMMAMLQTAKGLKKPLSLMIVEEAIGGCLHDLFENYVPPTQRERKVQ